jgi:hypothetical protein
MWVIGRIWMCDKFQRTSSAIEGRNGYLSRLHHANRGFSEQTLKVLTAIHNFDLKRHDGSTTAQKLFAKHFPDVFEWVVLNMGELPSPRKSKKFESLKCPPYKLSRLKLISCVFEFFNTFIINSCFLLSLIQKNYLFGEKIPVRKTIIFAMTIYNKWRH